MSKKSEEIKFISVDAEMETPKINLFMFRNSISFITGRVLTILDASIVDPTQREALKFLIKKELWATSDTVEDWFMDQTDSKGSAFPFRGAVNE